MEGGDFNYRTVEGSPSVMTQMVDLHLMAKQLKSFGLCELSILKALQQWHQKDDIRCVASVLNRAYENTEEGSSLRRVLVDVWVWSSSPDNPGFINQNIIKIAPRDFLRDVIWALAERTHDDNDKSCPKFLNRLKTKYKVSRPSKPSKVIDLSNE